MRALVGPVGRTVVPALGAALVLLVAVTAPASPASAAPGPASLVPTPRAGLITTGIPVHDTFHVTLPVAGTDEVGRFEGVVHAAYQIPDGTVVYWSLREAEGSDVGLAAALQPGTTGVPRLVGGVLADPEQQQVLMPLAASTECLCTTAADVLEVEDDHAFQTFYTTFPRVASATIDVDVDGRGSMVIGVPVLRQTPEPLLPSAVVPLGRGWPTYPGADRIAAVAEQDALDQVGRTGTDGGVVTEESGDGRLVSLDADVTFAWDRAAVHPQAEEALLVAVEQMRRMGATEIVVVGHTDATGDVARNDELSLLRAEAVAAVLAGVLGGEVTIQVEGRGQREPIADNGTDEGRAANRRATISYGTGGSSAIGATP